MFVIWVEFSIRPDHVDAFLAAIRENAATSLRDEPGCHRFDICQDPTAPSEIFLYEVYTDEAAFQAHLGAPHFKAFDAATAQMIADKSVRCLKLVSGEV